MRRLALLLPLLALAPLLSGCDSGEKEINTVTITDLSLLEIPFTEPNQSGWDDVFVRFKVNGVTVRTMRDDARRVRPADLAVDLDIGGDLDLRDLGFGLVIEVVNRESNAGSDIVIGASQVVQLQSLADATPSARVFQSANGQTRMNVTFEYD